MRILFHLVPNRWFTLDKLTKHILKINFKWINEKKEINQFDSINQQAKCYSQKFHSKTTSFDMFDQKKIEQINRMTSICQNILTSDLFNTKNSNSTKNIISDLSTCFYQLEIIQNVPNQVPNRLVVLNKIALQSRKNRPKNEVTKQKSWKRIHSPT